MKLKIRDAFDYLSHFFGILFAITAFVPGGILDLIVPWPGNQWRNILVVGIGLLFLAPINFIFFILDHACQYIADSLSNDEYI